MSWTPLRAVVVGNTGSGSAEAGVALHASSADTRPRARRFDLVGSLLGVAAAGLVHGVAGVEGRWVSGGFLSAVAGACAFPVVAAGILSGRGRDVWFGSAAGVAGFAFACLARSSGEVAASAAFTAYALIGLYWDWSADHGAAAWTHLARPWSTFHAVLALLVIR